MAQKPFVAWESNPLSDYRPGEPSGTIITSVLCCKVKSHIFLSPQSLLYLAQISYLEV